MSTSTSASAEPGLEGLRGRGPSIRRHIDLLGLLYVVGGALSVVAATSLFTLALGAVSIVTQAEDDNAAFAAEVTALAFGLAAVTLAVWGGANALAGRALRRGRPWARLACFALAVLNLFLLPFGTALTVYTFWVLLHPQARRLLSSSRRGPSGV